MKKNIVLALSLMVLAGVNNAVQAQEITDAPQPDTMAMAPAGEVMPSMDMPVEEPEEEEIVAAEDLADTTLPIIDGYMRNDAFKKAKPIPLPEIAAQNVKFYKRIWREIDLRDTVNSNIFFNANGTFTDLIVDAVKKGKVIAYDPRQTKKNPTGDGFTTRLTAGQAMGRLVDSVLVPQFDEAGNQIGATMQLNEFNPENITKYRLKEDIFFDKQRSKFETRIIGIAPLKKIEVGGEELTEPAFWLYFPHARKVLVTKEATDNLTYDDIFIQHSFASKITKDFKSSAEKIEDPAMVERQIGEYKERMWKY